MFSYLVYVSLSTMAKIVIGVLAGVFVSPNLSAPIESEKGLSFITLRILLSAMLFSNVCFDVSLTLLSKYYWAVIMSLVPMVLGGLMSLLCTRFVSREYKCLVVLGSTFQNGLVFPLTVVTSIKGVSWLDDEAVRHCQQFVFLYNLTCALGLWSIGSPMVKHYKDKFANEKIEAEAEADYLASLLTFYKRIVRREESLKSASTSHVSWADSGAVPLPDGETLQVETISKNAVQQLKSLWQHAPHAPHTSLRDMTIMDVLGEFMHRIRAARAAAGVDGQLGHASLSGTLSDFVPTEGSLSQQGLDEEGQQEMTRMTLSSVDDGHARREAGVAVAVMRAALSTSEMPVTPSTANVSTAQWLTAEPESEASLTTPTASRDASYLKRVSPTTRTVGAVSAPAEGDDARESQDNNTASRRRRYAEDEEVGSAAIPDTDAGRQLVLYRPLSGGGKMRPINVAKFDQWESRRVRCASTHANTTTEDERDGHAKRKLLARRPDAGADPAASPLFMPLEDVYQDPVIVVRAGGEKEKKKKKKEPFTYAYVSTIGSIVNGCCGGSSSSETDEPHMAVDEAGLPRDVELRERDRPCSYRFRKFMKIVNGAFQTMPVWATLLAICISLIPPLRWLAETIPCAMVIQGLHIIGEGCVPVQLVVLGCTLATKRLMDPLKLQRTDEEMREREQRAPATLVQRLTLKKLRERVLGRPRRRRDRRAVVSRARSTTTGVDQSTAEKSGDPEYEEGQPVDADWILTSQPVVETNMNSRSGGGAENTFAHAGESWPAPQALDLLVTEGLAAASGTRSTWSWWDRVPSATRLAIIVMALRLIIVPAISFLIVHILMKYQIMPTDRPFVVSILIGISSPAAVNSSLACTMHGYHADEYSRVMFVMHVAAVVTSTFWLVVSILYTERMGTDLYR